MTPTFTYRPPQDRRSRVARPASKAFRIRVRASRPAASLQLWRTSAEHHGAVVVLPPSVADAAVLDAIVQSHRSDLGDGAYLIVEVATDRAWRVSLLPCPELPVAGDDVRAFCVVKALSAGTLSSVHTAGARARVAAGDHCEPGATVALLTSACERPAPAVRDLLDQLRTLRFDGVATNREALIAWFEAAEVVRRDRWSLELAHALMNRRTRPNWYAGKAPSLRLIEVITAGFQSSIQALPGRLGLWEVGVPPSGPMDRLHAALANRALGNAATAPLIEITAGSFRFAALGACRMAYQGMDCRILRNGRAVGASVFRLAYGDVVDLEYRGARGARGYLAVAGGFRIGPTLGSAATFHLAGLGGWGGRTLKSGDRIGWSDGSPPTTPTPAPLRSPRLADDGVWNLRVTLGPHDDAQFFTPDYLATLLDSEWTVHHNSDRTGIRLQGPAPGWARPDGGEAGLHPSNIHDNAYAVGSIDFTGDMPIVLGPDGPSLGGFVCPAVVIEGDLWMLGQLKPRDRVRFRAVDLDRALAARSQTTGAPRGAVNLRSRSRTGCERGGLPAGGVTSSGVPWVVRQSGETHVLVEIGPPVLDIELRFIVQALYDHLKREQRSGVIDLTPGIRSLQVHFDPTELHQQRLVAIVDEFLRAYAEQTVGTIASRTVSLPLSWDDPATQKAIEIYTRSVYPDAPWCPSNIEFIRRVNGLDSVQAVREIVFAARYLVMGLGDVYLGAPVATPLDPRQRLVTTKYNPARTWTPQNAVGIGGAYLCVYGMEGPGGYQFVGRTVQVWNAHRRTPMFTKPWLLRYFDQIRFFPVDAQQLLEMRAALPRGGYRIDVQAGRFSLAEYRTFVAQHRDQIDRFTSARNAAYRREREAWQRMEHDGGA